ncbi:hypothetical protein RhiirA1_424167 [Rhizophagus irregularis]|uniref:Uncharacterized protein n=1 Tax=Rhizophagus irregularis TaxID=588596 RepID=A0A2N0RFN5_9GLOM|nr:hypothetical protein RhiirA1_424167 [Rhizophagus irregularis]
MVVDKDDVNRFYVELNVAVALESHFVRVYVLISQNAIHTRCITFLLHLVHVAIRAFLVYYMNDTFPEVQVFSFVFDILDEKKQL